MSEYSYAVDVRPLAPDLGGGFVARVLDLPGCVADGETPAEALANAYDAVRCWLAEAERLGRDVPQPSHSYA
jgi:predicted RNase H-like HicB family nuclease